MQTERVTFLTSPDHKAALDAYAATNRQSVGHVLREASARYMEKGHADEFEEALNLVIPELEAMLPKWNAQLDSMQHSIAAARKAVREALDAAARSK